MEAVLPFVVGILYATGTFLMLRRALARVLIGLALLTTGTNLLVFTAGGIVRGRPPLIEPGSEQLSPPYADPLPQAFILTAIVIGFGVLAFAVALAYRTLRDAGTEDSDELTHSEAMPEERR
ncbi:MAG: NADH-quinone oxidoreductase subunit K [Chloroflexota bacterium]|jgi:multicomponent Na+:H+ antiporter subunit C|nr:NADH-quinone oxidoreductase subunit K [Dehalococcoidia bacterium]MDW8046241.1 NADH-quinone oxidoreductase subunit K [Chloroflexota bacterium]